MNTVPIDQIKPAPDPVRKSWDEDKLNELAQSIKEQGLIVPIKVRPNGSGYEVVYGHRRLEAAIRIGMYEIPAIVEGVDDTGALIQALIENVQREDMSIHDKADAVRDLVVLGYGIRQLDRQGIVSQSSASDWLAWLEEYEAGSAVFVDKHLGQGDEGFTRTIEIRRSLKDDTEAKRLVSKKVSDDKLSRFEARAVADAYKAADTPELKESVLATSGKLGSADNILAAAKMKLGGEALTTERQERKREAFQEYDQAVKDFLDAVKLFDRMIKTANKAARFGKFSPEGARFARRRIDNLIKELEELKGALSNVS